MIMYAKLNHLLMIVPRATISDLFLGRDAASRERNERLLHSESVTSMNCNFTPKIEKIVSFHQDFHDSDSHETPSQI